MRGVVVAGGVVMVAIVAGGAGYVLRGRVTGKPRPLEVVRFERSLPRSERIDDEDGGALAMSADGRVLVAAVREGERTNLLLQYLDKFDAQAIPGTDGARDPFPSADGTTIGFSMADGSLKSVASAGGADASSLGSPGRSIGATFGPDGQVIVGRPNAGLQKGSGSSWANFTRLGDAERGHVWPHWIPGLGTVVFTVEFDPPKPSAIAIARLENPTSHVLVGDGRRAWFVDASHLVVARRDGLWSVSVREGSVTAQSRITADVGRSRDGVPVGAFGGGHLIYMYPADGDSLVRGPANGAASPRQLVPDRRAFSLPRLSPDGKSVAVVEAAAAGGFTLSIYDAATGGPATTTPVSATAPPHWTDDSRWVLFPQKAGEGWQLSWLARDPREGAGKLLTESTSADAHGTSMMRLRTPGVDAEWKVGKPSGGEVCVTVATTRAPLSERPPAIAVAGGVAHDACGNPNYDVSADGSQAVAIQRDPVARPSRLRYVLNFVSELRTP